LDKFESHSSDGIFLDYTPRGRSYLVLNLEINISVESCDVTFDKTAPCPDDVFESAGDKEMEECIFVDEELQSYHTPFQESGNKASICVPMMFKSHVQQQYDKQAPCSIV
jgi:hypothetical protein